MRFLRHIVMSLAFFVSCDSASFAQSVWQRFSASVSDYDVSFSYSFSMKSKTVITGTGTADVQGNMFSVTGNGLEIKCDGVSRWTVDQSAQEVYIESVEGDTDASLTGNPALMVIALDKYFTVKSSSNLTENGRKLVKVNFVPKNDMSFEIAGMKSSALTSLSVWFSDESRPVMVKASPQTKDGSVIDFKISSMKFSEKKPASFFRFNDSLLNSSWVVTDLR